MDFDAVLLSRIQFGLTLALHIIFPTLTIGLAVLGPLLGYEVMTAFFLKASFLGIMLFAWHRVRVHPPPRLLLC